MPDRDLIAEGRRLLDAATPGPWIAYAPEPDWWWVWQQQKLPNWGGVMEPRTGSSAAGAIGAAIATDNRDVDAERADAELIAYMRNTYWQLLDAAERLRRARESLVTTGYFTADQVNDDVAPRVGELGLRIAELEKAYGQLGAKFACAQSRIDDREQLRNLIRAFTDSGDCWFDHHGGCQAHGYLSLEAGELCPHAEAKQLIAGWDGEARSDG